MPIERATEESKINQQHQPTPGNSMAGRAPETLFGQAFGSPAVEAVASNVGRSAAGVTNASASFLEGNSAIVGAFIALVAGIWIWRNVT